MSTTVNVSPLKINYLTESQYQTALNNGEINSNELYFTPSVDCLPLTGGTLTGDLNGTSVNLSSRIDIGGDGYKDFLRIWSVSSSGQRANIVLRDDNTLQFTEYTTAGEVPRENYLLPQPTSTNTSGDWYNILTSKNAVTIAQGGTGQTTRADAMNALANLGTKPVTSTADDTVTTWRDLRAGIAWYNASDQLYGQPTAYGFLINLNTTASQQDVHQIWAAQNHGSLFHRGGNSGGWADIEWKLILDSENYTNLVTPANIGAATSGHNHDGTYLKLIGGTMTGMITFNSSTASTSSFKMFAAKSSDDTKERFAMWAEADHSVSFVETLKGASVSEVYLLPTPTSGNSARYNILTDKAGIELPRGGIVISSNSHYFRVDRSDYSAASTPSANQYLTFAGARSTTDGYDRAYIRYFGGTDGKQGIQLETRRTISSTNYYNTLTMTIGTDGTKYVSVSDPAAWRSALGLGSMATQASSSYLPLSGGNLTGIVSHLTSGDIYREFFNLYDSSTNTKRTLFETNANNSFGITEFRTGSSTVWESYHLPAPTGSSNATYEILTTKGFYMGGVGTTAVNFTVKTGSWLIVTGHNSTAALNTLTMLRVGGPRIMPIYAQADTSSTSSGYTMNGNIGFKLSGNTLTVIATAGGSASVYGIFLG